MAAGYGERWYRQRGPGAVLSGLIATWLELPGASHRGQTVSVYDGDQPITIRLARRRGLLVAVIHTPIGTSPVAWRVWSRGQPAPPLDPELRPHGGPPVSRAAALEAAFGGPVVSVETSDVRDAARHLDSQLRQKILGLKLQAHTEWRGVTYDGRVLGIHFCGATAADPERATALARSVWKVFT